MPDSDVMEFRFIVRLSAPGPREACRSSWGGWW
jgi:hypothetical protein